MILAVWDLVDRANLLAIAKAQAVDNHYENSTRATIKEISKLVENDRIKVSIKYISARPVNLTRRVF